MLMGQSPKSAGGGSDLFCWLCDAPMVVEQASNRWYSRELHSGCFNAVRCRCRLLKTTDKQLLEKDEEELGGSWLGG